MADIADFTDMITTIGVFFEDQAVAGTYDYACAMNARAFAQSRERRQESVVTTCGPGAPLEFFSAPGPRDWTISGSGAMELDTWTYLNSWMRGDGSDKTVRNVQIVFYTGPKDTLAAHSYVRGSALLTQLEAGQAEAEGLTTATLTIVKAGPDTYALGAPT